MRKFIPYFITTVGLIIAVGLIIFQGQPTYAAPDLTIEMLTWNIIGLDSNDPANGPRCFPVGARICSIGGPSAGPVVVDFTWNDTVETYIRLRSGSLDQITFNSGLGTGECADAYFEVEVGPTAASSDRTRRYTITASDGVFTVSTPQPRELFVEHLISQNRNATLGVRYGTTPSNLTSVPPGGSMNLVVGETYLIELTGGTAAQGYEQLESFLTLTNTIFQITDVDTCASRITHPFF